MEETFEECCKGYKMVNDICVFHCEKQIQDGKCIGPNQYECEPKFLMVEAPLLIKCVPTCNNCDHGGFCKGLNKCQCYRGFGNGKNGACFPICESGCFHGKCIEPQVCACDEGESNQRQFKHIISTKKNCFQNLAQFDVLLFVIILPKN